MKEVNSLETDWIPINKIKEKNTLIDLKTIADFNSSANNKTLNPSGIIFEDREKYYFSDDNPSGKTYYILMKSRVRP